MSLVALSISLVLLTIFAYLICIFHFQTKKPTQFMDLRTHFIYRCKEKLPKNLVSSEYHLSMANAAYKMASNISKNFQNYMLPVHRNDSMNKLISSITNLYHRKDIIKMKEGLFLFSIREHINLIKQVPTNLEAHASLANAYIALSKVYKGEAGAEKSYISTVNKAIQEYKILDHLAPNDPWVHAQLASCNHDIKNYNEEINQYEKVLKLCPEDKQVIFRLGILCFQQGKTARGLELYEMLKKGNFSRAEELIEFYDTNIEQEYIVSDL